MNITSLNAVDIHAIYYRERTFLIQDSDQLINGVEVAIPGIHYTIFYNLEADVNLLPRIIVLDFNMPAEEILIENFHKLPRDSYKSVENLTVGTLAKALRGELTVGGIVPHYKNSDSKLSDTNKFQVMELIKIDGRKLAGMIVNEQSYEIIGKALNPDIQKFEEEIEGQSR